MKKWLITLILLISLSGCIKSLNQEGEVVYSADPCTVVKFERQAEGAIGVLGLLGMFWPALIPIATAAGGVYGTYKRIKPALEEKRTEAELYHASTKTLVDVIEDIKKNQPELWLKLKPVLVDSQMAKNVEQVIWALKQEKPNI